MQITTKQLTPTKIEITVIADAELLNSVHKAVVADMGKQVQIAGFRKGHAPANMAEKALDQQQLQMQFLDSALNELYTHAIIEKQLRPVGQPEVSITKFVPYKTLEAKLTIDAVGKVEVADYKKLKVAAVEAAVEDKEVESVIDDLLARSAEKTKVDRAAKNGDEVVIAFKGIDAKTKEPIKGGEGSSYPLVLGSNTFIPGFEPEILGLKGGDEKTFDITFPKDYGAKDLQGKKVTFTVNVDEVREVVLPKLDGDFASKVGPFKTPAELRADVRKQLLSEKQFQTDRQFENNLLTALAEKSKADLPDALIDDEVERMIAEEKRNVLYRGQTWPEYLEMLSETEEKHRETVRVQAELRVKTGVVLGEAAQQENVDVTDAELQERMTQLKEQYKSDAQMQAELDKPENHRDIASRILTEKTIAKLVGYVKK